MNYRRSYLALIIGFSASATLLIGNQPAVAQGGPNSPTQADMYCSGVVSTERVPGDTYVISGEDSDHLSTFTDRNDIFINRGADQGIKVGDEFEIVRPVADNLKYRWFKWQPELEQAMGTFYADIAHIRVVSAQQKTATAQIISSCDPVERGDIVRPFADRPAPPFHQIRFDPLAPPSGKKTAMIVITKNFGQAAAAWSTVYVNLGSAQGVQVGDYFRVFRYQGVRYDSTYLEKNTQYKAFGFGSTPVAYTWNDLPRQIVGEGIVLRTGPNSSTVLLTAARQTIFTGDYVEVE